MLSNTPGDRSVRISREPRIRARNACVRVHDIRRAPVRGIVICMLPRAVRNFHETGGNSVREIRHGEHAREREKEREGGERTRSIGTAGREAKERENRIYSMLVKDVLSKHGTNLREKRTLKSKSNNTARNT